MNLNSVKNAITSNAGRNVLKIKKNSPTLMFGAGVVGMVGTVVLASKATLQLESVLDETDTMKEKAKLAREKYPDKYSEKDLQKDMVIVHVRQYTKLAKLYAPSLALGTVSIACLTGSHVTLTKRNAGLVAAYATIEKSFNQYRERVLAEVGPEREREFFYGTEDVTTAKVDEKGKPVNTTKKVAGGTSMYAKFFDESNPNWTASPESNLFFLKLHQQHLNDQLMARGHVFLNEVYDALGMERTQAGAVVGWVKGYGDDFIDFGIWDDDTMDRTLDFMTRREDCLLLDFNVDGVIYDKI